MNRRSPSAFVPYEDRFGNLLPRAVYPLPTPCPVALGDTPRWWGAYLDWAENYVQQSPVEPPTRRFPRHPRGMLLGSIHADIWCNIGFYYQWCTTPVTEDVPVRYPCGLQALIDDARGSVLAAVRIGRAGDAAQHIVDEYADAYDRCAALCDARRRGGLGSAPYVFSREDVDHAMKDITGRFYFVGLVDYQHIRQCLYRAAVPE